MSRQRHLFVAQYGSPSQIEAEYSRIDNQKNQFLNRVFYNNPHRKNLSGEFIDRIYRDDDVPNQKMNAVHHHNLSAENLEHAHHQRLNDQIQTAAIMHHKTNHDQLRRASNHAGSEYNRSLARLTLHLTDEARAERSKNWHDQ